MYRLFLILWIFILADSAELFGYNESKPGKIGGVVIDSDTKEPVPFAYIHFVEINRTATTDKDGKFRFSNVPEGTFVIAVHRIGYVTQRRTVRISTDESDGIIISISPTVLTGQAIEIVGDPDNTLGSNLEHASIHVIGDQLRRELGVTLSETLDSQPGFSQRSMGPAPGRPVMRGLGNERVLILQDGETTGDVSWTSADHAVTVDPSSAEEIEIARGPAALLYGSSAIGGVINVVHNQIPNSIPSSLTGSISLHGATVNQGATATGSLTIPSKNFVTNLDLNGRTGGNFSTPVGTLTNTSLQSMQNALGSSYIRPWGYAGASASMYLSKYGIPPDPDGGHPNGVNIEMQKYQVDARSEVLLTGSFLKLLEIHGTVINYHHKEIESDGFTGTEYLRGTNTATLKTKHNNWSFIDDGVIGISGEFVSNAVRGSRTPDSRFITGSVFTMQETDFGSLHLEAGLRFDHVIALPVRERVSPSIGHIRKRSFSAVASSFSAIFDLGRNFYLGSTFMHSFRPPSFDELYSEGPHLAAYSYEVGNPDLEPERGLGSELFFRYRAQDATIQFAGYHNYFGNYLHAQNTGQPSPRRNDLNLYQYVGTQASIYGLELATEFKLPLNFVLEGNSAYTIGDRVVSEEEKAITGLEDSEQPLPMIPPFSSTVGIRYAKKSFSIGGQSRIAAPQTRIGEFETETPGYAIFNFNLQYRVSSGSGTFHTFTLNMHNIFNKTYYNHLSRIKEIFPEPGRNVSILYRMYF